MTFYLIIHICKTRGTNPSHTRIRHPTTRSSLSSPKIQDTSQNRQLKSHYRSRQQPRKEYRLFLSPSKIV